MIPVSSFNISAMRRHPRNEDGSENGNIPISSCHWTHLSEAGNEEDNFYHLGEFY